MSQMSHQMSQNVTFVTFSVRKLEHGLWIIPVRTDPYQHMGKKIALKYSPQDQDYVIQTLKSRTKKRTADLG